MTWCDTPSRSHLHERTYCCPPNPPSCFRCRCVRMRASVHLFFHPLVRCLPSTRAAASLHKLLQVVSAVNSLPPIHIASAVFVPREVRDRHTGCVIDPLLVSSVSNALCFLDSSHLSYCIAGAFVHLLASHCYGTFMRSVLEDMVLMVYPWALHGIATPWPLWLLHT